MKTKSKVPPPHLRIGFGELARHLGLTSDDVSDMCCAGEIEWVPGGGTKSVRNPIRLISRKAANKYLRRNGLPLVSEEAGCD